MSFAVREVLWLQKIELESKLVVTPINLGCDNHGAFSIASKDKESDGSKHIDLK